MAEIVRVSIGSEPLQLVNARILESSILRRTSRNVEITSSWRKDQGWHPLTQTLPKIKNGTKFALWRWLVPEVYGFTGKAIYLDADQVCFADIGELWDSLPEGKAFACVKNAEGIFGNKVPEKGKNQTSVMVMDCGNKSLRTYREWLEYVTVHAYTYKELMQATWVSQQSISELPHTWNLFGVDHPDKKLIHFSHVASQPIRNPQHPIANLWFNELMETVIAGHVTREEIKAEVKAGHVHPHWWEMLK